ncbi:hypothetical protein DL96DRAFT_1601534 [Flagelloscypha sp. PMI_526]|nr:hypothetical protein DL96DRAFT_1601534 [Flagelloscypha sp. PMI_526]
MAPKFCCCLPLRLGVFLISGIQALFSLVCAGLLWASVAGQHGAFDKVLGENAQALKDVPTRTKVVTILYATSLTFLSLSCIFGFFGTIRRKYSLVASYASFSKAFFVVLTLLAIVNIVIMWMDKGKSADACREALKNVQDTGGFDCNTNTFLIVGTVIALIPVFLQLYAAIVVHQYRNHLASEQNRQLPDAHYSKVSTSDNVEYRPYQYPFSTPDTGYSGNHHS